MFYYPPIVARLIRIGGVFLLGCHDGEVGVTVAGAEQILDISACEHS
jgi:hypothetical protein